LHLDTKETKKSFGIELSFMAEALGQRRVGLVKRLVILEDKVELGVSLLEYVHKKVRSTSGKKGV
jgi:hypothetical protein